MSNITSLAIFFLFMVTLAGCANTYKPITEYDLNNFKTPQLFKILLEMK